MELKEERRYHKEFMKEYYEMRMKYDTRCMTDEEIWSLPCNKELYEMNKDHLKLTFKGSEKEWNLEVTKVY